jgi:hypothetical protein
MSAERYIVLVTVSYTPAKHKIEKYSKTKHTHEQTLTDPFLSIRSTPSMKHFGGEKKKLDLASLPLRSFISGSSSEPLL